MDDKRRPELGRGLRPIPLKALASGRTLVPTGYPYTFLLAQFKASEIKKYPFYTHLVWGKDKSYKIFEIEREARP